MMRYGICVIVSAALVCSAWGCGSGNPRTIKVTGTLKLKGKAEKGMMVTFNPDSGDRPASGITNEQGAFTLSTFADGDGALPGKHTVTIAESFMDKPPPGPGMGPLPSRFPQKYADISTSPIKEEVSESKSTFSWDITDTD